MDCFRFGLLVLLSVTSCNAFFVTIDAHAEECFFEKVTAGTKLGNIKFLLCTVVKRMKT